MTRYAETESEYMAELQEKERIAWANGDTEKAALLAELIEARELVSDLERQLLSPA